MRRPLCALALAVTAVMYLVLRFLPPALPDYAEFDGSTVRLQGRVLSKEYRVSKNGVISLLITLGNIHCPSGPSTKNHVLVRVPVSENDNKTEYEGHMSHIPREFPEAPEDDLTPIGALICVTGKVRAFETARNPGEFDARLYYRTLGCDYSISGARVTAVNGKRSVIGDTLYRLRRAMAGVFDRCLSQEDASVMKALLLGEKGWLDQETKDLYRRSGIIHILAVSGLHISLVGLGITGLLRQIHAPKCLQRLLAPLVVSIYCLMAGPGPSSVRALIMYLTPSAAVSVSYRLSVFVRGGAFDRRTDACAARESRQNTGDPRPYTSGIYGQRIYFPARRCFPELSCSAFYADIDDFRRSRSCRRFSVRARRQSDLALLSCDTVFL